MLEILEWQERDSGEALLLLSELEGPIIPKSRGLLDGLISKMLSADPAKRLTAEEAFQEFQTFM